MYSCNGVVAGNGQSLSIFGNEAVDEIKPFGGEIAREFSKH